MNGCPDKNVTNAFIKLGSITDLGCLEILTKSQHSRFHYDQVLRLIKTEKITTLIKFQIWAFNEIINRVVDTSL